MRKIITYLFCFFLLSCRYDEDTFLKPHGENNSHVPLAYGSLGLMNYVKDTLIKKDLDGALKLVYEQQISSKSLDTFSGISNTSDVFDVSISSFAIPDINQSLTASLGELLKGTALEALAFANIGNMIPLPALPLTTLSPKIISADNIDYVKFSDGMMHTSISNNLPLEILTYKLELYNAQTTQLILSEELSNISPSQSKSNDKSLAGITLPNLMYVLVSIALKSSGATSVLIDTTKKADGSLALQDLKAVSGRAVIPLQNFTQSLEFPISPVNKDSELKKVIFNTGTVEMNLLNYFGTGIHLDVAFPSISKGYTVLDAINNISAKNGSVAGGGIFPVLLDGYSADIYSGDSYKNFIPFNINLQVGGTPDFVVFDLLHDKLSGTFSLKNLNIEKVVGWFGSTTINLSQEQELPQIPIFKKIDEGSIAFKDVNFKLKFTNTTGLDAAIKLNLTSIGSKDGKEVNLEGNKDFLIKKALDFPLTPDPTNVFELNNTNSNIEDLISGFPKQINSSFSITTNPNGYTTHNFIYSNSSIGGSLLIEAPLKLLVKSLTFADTTPLQINLPAEVSMLKKGDLVVQIHNGFPYSMNVEVTLLDANLQAIDILDLKDIAFAAAEVGKSGKVSSKKISEAIVHITPDLFEKLKKTTKIRFKAIVDSNGNAYQIYNDYDIDFKILADLLVEY